MCVYILAISFQAGFDYSIKEFVCQTCKDHFRTRWPIRREWI